MDKLFDTSLKKVQKYTKTKKTKIIEIQYNILDFDNQQKQNKTKIQNFSNWN